MIKKKTHTVLVKFLIPILIISIPFSVSVPFGVHEINLPSEPLMGLIGLLLLFVVDFKDSLFLRFLKSPISKISLGFLVWMLVSTMGSSHPLISLKYLLVSTAHWWIFYVGLGYFLLKKEYRIDQYFIWYAASFLLIMFFSWYRHSLYDFRIDASVLTARPFYYDHALYSAVMCLLLFPSVGFASLRTNKVIRLVFAFAAFLLLIGIYLSFSRAAWLSLGLTIGLFFLLYTVRSGILVLSILVFLVFGSAFVSLTSQSSNTEVRRQKDLSALVESIFNLSSDVSNLERINRYRSAWRMFLDRPVIGFGPGTFASSYLPYQKEREMTRLSVTSTTTPDGLPHPPGKGGGAHSEYFQALAESGMTGLVIWILIIGFSIHAGIGIFMTMSGEERWIILAIVLGLISFSIHTIFNNFFHNEKVTFLFWTYLAYIAINKSLFQESR